MESNTHVLLLGWLKLSEVCGHRQKGLVEGTQIHPKHVNIVSEVSGGREGMIL